MNVEEYRNSRKNIKIVKKLKLKKVVVNFINKVLVTAIIFLIGLIVTSKNVEIKNLINKYVYIDSINFVKLKKMYNKYFGKYIGEKSDSLEKVFNEKISYKEPVKYKDGVKLNVDNNYLVPTIEAGIVIYIGEKEDYGSTIVVQQVNGINVWYSNININDIKIYDYVKKGELIGTSKTDEIYMVFEKNGEFLNYKEYI